MSEDPSRVRWGDPLTEGDIVKLDKGDCVVSGTYLSRRKVETKKGYSMLHKLRLVEAPFGLDDARHGAGSVIQFWGSTMLDSYLSQVQQGSLVRIAFAGIKTLRGGADDGGDRQMKDWDVRLPLPGEPGG